MEQKNKQGVQEFVRPIVKFIRTEINAGIVLLVATIAALIVANSSYSDVYFNFFESTYIDFKFEFWELSKPLYCWINDGLMGIFFFVIGLEVKREIKIGELSTKEKALLPGVAAIGGMLFPALFYVFFNYSDSAYINGWAIPMATDIAFALGVLSLLGKRVPLELKIFLTSLAVVDDIGAVLTIAVFYTSEISFTFLFIAIGVWLVLFLLNKVGVRSIWVYIIIGIFGVWYPLLKSGVHATIAGVLVAFTIPMDRKFDAKGFVDKVRFSLKQFTEAENPDSQLLTFKQYDSIDDIKNYCNKVSSPLQKLENSFHNITFYFIMPVFAFANTGIRFDDIEISSFFNNSLPLGIFTGLVLGKVLGIFFFVYIFRKLKIIKLPDTMCMQHIIGAGFLAGIGFTMSIFISELAFRNDELINISKFSILFASLISGLLGAFIIKFLSKKPLNC
jgi:NhaA family Na+:H+ antiporter